ncbi:condensation domain-containing protein [Microtetraspora niveoalba]|uniref:condensation domain-containing protein n=1 Tax=Microtetraspora niveoalba TaxID=46175 RepID=UPI000834A264|nr:condensation domain-containing protein [Microtetraspora niveoalba]
MSLTLVGEGEQASLAQHGMWVTERMGAGGRVYRMPVAVWFDGPLDTDRLLSACGAVVEAHPALATALVERDGVLRRTPAAVAPPVRFEDAQGRDPAGLIDREMALGLDLGTGPLARFTLLRLAPERHVLVFVAHHAVFDGMSKDILVRDLAAAYAGRPLPVAGGGAVEEEDALVAERLDAAGGFWRSRWRDRPELSLPGLVAPSVRAAAGEALDFSVGPDVAAAAERIGVTRFELVLAALHALLRAYGNDGAAVAVDLSTRTERTRDEIGLFVNELPVTVPSAAAFEGTFADLARAVREELRAVYGFRRVPLARAVGGVSPRTALTPVSVSYRRRDGDDPDFPGLRVSVDRMMFNQAVRGTLHLQIVDGPDGVAARFQYNPAVLGRAHCETVTGHLLALLDAVAARPDAGIADLPLPEPVPEAAGEYAADDAPGDAAPADAAPTAGEAPPYAREMGEIWCEVLRREAIGPDEDLFELGGHSLSITEIIAKVRERLDVELSFDVFFDAPTINGVAEEIARLKEEAC